jgi:hypothetical protein
MFTYNTGKRRIYSEKRKALKRKASELDRGAKTAMKAAKILRDAGNEGPRASRPYR